MSKYGWGINTGSGEPFGTPSPGYEQPGGPGVSRTLQTQAVNRLGGALGASRAGVIGAYDDAIRSRQAANALAIRQMQGGIAAPAAATLVGSGAAGMLASGAAQASGRQMGLTAGLERERILKAGADEEARILGQKAAAEMGFAEKDIEAFDLRMKDHNDLIDQKRKSRPLKRDMMRWLKGQRDSFAAGSPEWELYNNEMIQTESNLLFSG